MPPEARAAETPHAPELSFDRESLERLYTKYNRREFVHPDPIEFLYKYRSRPDREVAGLIAASVALIGFGVDSFIETASAAVLTWRLWAELRSRSAEAAERAERLASRIAGTLLLLLAAYLVIDAGRRLLGHGARAEESVLGIVLTALSLVVIPRGCALLLVVSPTSAIATCGIFLSFPRYPLLGLSLGNRKHHEGRQSFTTVTRFSPYLCCPTAAMTAPDGP